MPDWTAVAQGASAIVQAMGVLVTLALTYKLAKDSHIEAQQREIAQDAQLLHQQENAAWTLLSFISGEAQRLGAACRLGHEEPLEDGLRILQLFANRAAAAQVDLLSPSAASSFFHAVRAAMELHGRASSRGGVATHVVADQIEVLKGSVTAHVDDFVRHIGRDPMKDIVNRAVQFATRPRDAPAADS